MANASATQPGRFVRIDAGTASVAYFMSEREKVGGHRSVRAPTDGGSLGFCP